eukprot:m.1639999 g.1639999  ORF g.1639999 m.1639999 type:complete len:385 (+) comp39138_c0_seq1:231-1385(+)
MKRVHEKGKRKKQKARALQAASEDAEWAEIENKPSSRMNRGLSAAQIRGNLRKALGGGHSVGANESSTSSTVLAAMTALLSSKSSKKEADGEAKTKDKGASTQGETAGSEKTKSSEKTGSSEDTGKKKRKASRRGKKGKGSGEVSDEPAQTPVKVNKKESLDTSAKHTKKKMKAAEHNHKDAGTEDRTPGKKCKGRNDSRKDGDASSAIGTSSGKDGKVDLALERVPGTAYIRDVPLDASRTDVSDALKKFGDITSCRLVFDKVTRKPNGTAFVDFAKATSVKKAAAASRELGGMDFIWCHGRRLRVDFALTSTGVHAIVNRNTARPSYSNLNKRKKGPPDATAGKVGTQRTRGGPGGSRGTGVHAQKTGRPKTIRIRRAKPSQ